MYRPIIRSLIEAVEQQEVRQLLLDGMPGAGKSVALSLLAQWARRKGWVVRTLPVPLAYAVLCCSVTCMSKLDMQTPMQHHCVGSRLAAQIKLYVRGVQAKSRITQDLTNAYMMQVLYVANAEVLTDGGFYSQNEAADGWDTPQSAQYILHNLLASHRDALEKLRTKDGSRSLAEVGWCKILECWCANMADCLITDLSRPTQRASAVYWMSTPSAA